MELREAFIQASKIKVYLQTSANEDGYGRSFIFNSWKFVFSQFLMFRFPNCLLWKAGLLQIFYGFKTYINSMICRPSTEASRTEVGIKDLQYVFLGKQIFYRYFMARLHKFNDLLDTGNPRTEASMGLRDFYSGFKNESSSTDLS